MIGPGERVHSLMITRPTKTPLLHRRSVPDFANGAEQATMESMEHFEKSSVENASVEKPPTDDPAPAADQRLVNLSRRSVLLGGIGFLAACSSATTDSAAPASADIVLGGEEPETSAADVRPTPTPDPERSPIKPTSFDYLEGNPGTLTDFAGTPLVINFFASWCPPCRKELPDFEEISQKYSGQVEFLGFSVSDDAETTRELLAETGVTFPVGMDPDQSIHFDLGGIAMPTTLFVDRFGNLATGRFGAISKDNLEQLILEEIL